MSLLHHALILFMIGGVTIGINKIPIAIYADKKNLKQMKDRVSLIMLVVLGLMVIASTILSYT